MEGTPVRWSSDVGREEELLQRPSGEEVKVSSHVPFSDLPHDFFELDDTCTTLGSAGFRKVALQFPDELLPYAPEVCRRLQAGLGRDVMVFVLGDTSYGACCVDEVAAQHLNADVVVHYGRTCLSPTSHMPVLFVFGRRTIDVDHVIKEFKESFPLVEGRTQDLEEGERLVLYCDVEYAYAVSDIETKLREAGYPSDQVVISQIDRFYVPAECKHIFSKTARPDLKSCNQEASSDAEGKNEKATKERSTAEDKETGNTQTVFGRRIPAHQLENSKHDSILFIGEEGPTLTNFLMARNQSKIWRYSPPSKQLWREALTMNKALMRRYFLIEKTKDAAIIGIVAGTLGVSKYLQIIEHMKHLIKKAGKKPYTFVVGKLNPHKLANFEHIDVFVLVACPENSLVDSKEFYKPIITPYELELALTKGREWTGEYITDFSDLLPSLAPTQKDIQKSEGEEEEADSDSDAEDEPRISLIDGKLKPSYRPESGVRGTGHELVVSGSQSLAVTVPTAASFLSQRHWKGLEQRLGETEVTLAEEGRSGIPKGYTHGSNETRT